MTVDTLKIKRTLAADQRFGELDLTNDQVWELDTSGDPAAVAMRTSFGLRCSGLRIYPQFTLQGITLTDPHTFAAPVSLLKRRSNYLLLEFDPFTLLNVQLELWVPASQVLCCRFKLTNHNTAAMNFAVTWSVVLDPLDHGEHMSAMQMGVNTVLQGRSGELHPVLFLTGGPEPLERAHPSLEVRTTLPRGASRKLSWALAALDSVEASFSMARQSTSLAWDARAINGEMLDKSSILEFAGDGETNLEMLHEAQIKAHQLLVPASANSGRSTFLTRRQPDGRVFAPVSRRQELISFSQVNTYDAWMLSRLLLPANPQPVKEIIQSFIDIQQDDGSIPWAVSAGGAVSSAKTPPLLAGIVCDVYPSVNDKEWLHQVHSPLLRSLKAWFPATGENLPTWQNPLQAGLENNPLYEFNESTGLGMDATLIHSPALDSFLYHECAALLKIADWLGETDTVEWLKQTSERLSTALDGCWDADRSCYTYRDTETGQGYQHEAIHDFTRNGIFKMVRNFKTPRRLTLSVPGQSASTGAIHITLAGKIGETNLSEEIVFRPKYSSQQSVTRKLFSRLESVEINGLPAKAALGLGTAGNDSEDISLLLPLWSGAMPEEKIDLLIENSVLPRYLSPSGLVKTPMDCTPSEINVILPFWNNLIIEGLVRCGRRDVAGKIVEPLLKAQLEQWQKNGYVSSAFTARDLLSRGELDTLAGLPAIWPLLQTMGIDRIVGKDIFFLGLNEYLPPITVKYKGTSIEMKSVQTTIQTLRNEKVEIKEQGPCKAVLP
jgi:hypothetical protein